jgi:dUTP pyrophosphatase
MYVYFAEPGDFNTGEWRHLADQAHRILVEQGATVFRPVAGWSLPRRPTTTALRDLNQVNREALESCDLVVAVLPPDTRTLGVPMEIGWATDEGINVLALVGEDYLRSTMLRGNPRVQLFGHDQLDEFTDTVHTAMLATIRSDLALARMDGPAGGNGESPGAVAGIEPTPRPLPFTMDLRHPLYPGGLIKHYLGDAGFDLFTAEDVRLGEGEFTMIRCGVNVELPPDVFGWIVARSSTFPNWGIIVSPGIIDSGYRGELTVPAWRAPVWEVQPEGEANTSRADRVWQHGDKHLIPAGTRLAQLVLLPNMAAQFTARLTNRLTESDRGSSGFGSTGVAAVSGESAVAEESAG